MNNAETNEVRVELTYTCPVCNERHVEIFKWLPDSPVFNCACGARLMWSTDDDFISVLSRGEP